MTSVGSVRICSLFEIFRVFSTTVVNYVIYSWRHKMARQEYKNKLWNNSELSQLFANMSVLSLQWRSQGARGPGGQGVRGSGGQGARGSWPQSRKIMNGEEGNAGPTTGCLIHRVAKYRPYADVYVRLSLPVLPVRKEMWHRANGIQSGIYILAVSN